MRKPVEHFHGCRFCQGCGENSYMTEPKGPGITDALALRTIIREMMEEERADLIKHINNQVNWTVKESNIEIEQFTQ